MNIVNYDSNVKQYYYMTLSHKKFIRICPWINGLSDNHCYYNTGYRIQ